jgi:hypothetical protein
LNPSCQPLKAVPAEWAWAKVGKTTSKPRTIFKLIRIKIRRAKQASLSPGDQRQFHDYIRHGRANGCEKFGNGAGRAGE